MYSNKGLSLIAALFIITALALMGAVVSYMSGGLSLISSKELSSTRAIAIAEGGIEYALKLPFPNYYLANPGISFAGGNFFIEPTGTEPPTLVTDNPLAAGAVTVNVSSTTGFRTPAGRIVIGNEQIDYTGTTPTSFTGCTRGVGVPPTTASTHNQNDFVYQATTLNGAISNVVNTITVLSTTGFDTSGVIKIDNEYIFYTSKNATQFLNCTRGYKGSTAIGHGNGKTVFQYKITVTGYVGGIAIPEGRRVVEFYAGQY